MKPVEAPYLFYISTNKISNHIFKLSSLIDLLKLHLSCKEAVDNELFELQTIYLWDSYSAAVIAID